MYESHWGLKQSPFRDAPNPRLFYRSPTHLEALARLEFLVERRRRMGLLLGSGGSGKSLLLQILASELLAQGTPVATVNLLGLDARDFLWNLAAQLGTSPSTEAATFVLWRQIVDRLAQNRYQRLTTVLLLDDADEATSDVLSYILRVTHGDTSPDAALTIVLTSSPQAVAKLGPRLLDISELKIELEPWDEHDTLDYVRSRLEQEGGQADLFERDAAIRLHELAGGLPRQINQLANLALLAGAGRQLRAIDQHTVEAVFEELKLRCERPQAAGC